MRTRYPNYFIIVYDGARFSVEGPHCTDEDWLTAILGERDKKNFSVEYFVSPDPKIRIDSERTVAQFLNGQRGYTRVPAGTILKCDPVVETKMRAAMSEARIRGKSSAG